MDSRRRQRKGSKKEASANEKEEEGKERWGLQPVRGWKGQEERLLRERREMRRDERGNSRNLEGNSRTEKRSKNK